MLSHFLNPPNWFTAASIFCTVYAISLLVGGPPLSEDVLARAAVLVVFGGVFDMLDGRVARLTNRQSAFGVQLDSLADVLSFGFAPALLAWAWRLHELGNLGVLLAFWFVLCACFRLARFNVNTESVEHAESWPHPGHTQGLSTTMAGGSLVTLVWVANGYLATSLSGTPALFVAGITGLLGLLMVSELPFRSFKDVRSNRYARTTLAVSLACCLAGAVFLNASMWFGVGAILYLSVGLVDGLVVMNMAPRREDLAHRRSGG